MPTKNKLTLLSESRKVFTKGTVPNLEDIYFLTESRSPGKIILVTDQICSVSTTKSAAPSEIPEISEKELKEVLEELLREENVEQGFMTSLAPGDLLEEEQDTPGKGYRYNFRLREDLVNKYYQMVRRLESRQDHDAYKKAVARLYKSVADLAFAIFCVDPPEHLVKSNGDFYDTACEYSLYLTYRIQKRKLVWDPTIRHAWTKYIRLNTKYIYHTLPVNQAKFLSLDHLLDELDFLLDSADLEDVTTPLPESVTYQDPRDMMRREFFDKVMVVLKTFYTKNEINRFVPLVISSLLHDFELPEEVQRFRSLMLTMIRRVSTLYETSDYLKPTGLTQSVDRSVITLILLSYLTRPDVNKTLPFELVSSLDFHSMVRLSIVAGGKSLYIPSLDDLELVVASSVALSSMLSEGKSFKDSRYVAKDIVGCRKDVRRLNRFMREMSESLDPGSLRLVAEMNKGGEVSFLSDLLSNLRVMTDKQKTILDKLDKEIIGASPAELIESLQKLDDYERKLISFIERFSQLQSSKI
jgi:hypothetical protein